VLPVADSPAARTYQQICAACHMPNGTGVPGMQPALAGSAVVAGDPARLIDVLLRGPAAVLPADREKFGTVMPPFATLSDEEIASVASFVRRQFGGAGEVTPADVRARR
jgi:nitrite reductase (NO-forming)